MYFMVVLLAIVLIYIMNINESFENVNSNKFNLIQIKTKKTGGYFNNLNEIYNANEEVN